MSRLAAAGSSTFALSAISGPVFSTNVVGTVIEPFFDATTRISLAIDDTELRQGTEMADAAARQVEVMSLLLNGGGVAQRLEAGEGSKFVGGDVGEHVR